MTEEEVREKISRWKEKYENLLSSTEGRKEREDSFIVFKSIYVGKGIKIDYMDEEGEKRISSGEEPREEFMDAMNAMGFYCSDCLGKRMMTGKGDIIHFNVRKVIICYTKEGVIKGIKPQGYVEIYGLPWKVSFTSSEKLLPTELMMEYLNKLFDEAYLFIQGARRKKEE